MRTKGVGLALTATSVVASLLAGAGPTANAAPSRVELAGGVVKVRIGDATPTFLSITQVSHWDVSQKEPSCLRPLKGQTEVDFDLNYSSTSQSARVPGMTLSMRSAHRDRFGIAVAGSRCRQLSNYHFPSQQAGVQSVRGAAVFLRKDDALGALRVTIDGHAVRLKLHRGCEALDPSQSAACLPFPVVRVRR